MYHCTNCNISMIQHKTTTCSICGSSDKEKLNNKQSFKISNIIIDINHLTMTKKFSNFHEKYTQRQEVGFNSNDYSGRPRNWYYSKFLQRSVIKDSYREIPSIDTSILYSQIYSYYFNKNIIDNFETYLSASTLQINDYLKSNEDQLYCIVTINNINYFTSILHLTYKHWFENNDSDFKFEYFKSKFWTIVPKIESTENQINLDFLKTDKLTIG